VSQRDSWKESKEIESMHLMLPIWSELNNKNINDINENNTL
jgi:hypothetical protein